VSDSIEPGRDRFTASNGWYVEDGRDVFDEQGDYVTDINSQELTVAVAEYVAATALAKRDHELGRVRVEGYPDYVVYPQAGGVVVIHEVEGGRWRYYDAPGFITQDSDYVARAWFALREPPKPWMKAVEGSAWRITVPWGTFAAIFQAGRFRHYGGSWATGDITDAELLWSPEAGDES